MKQLIFYLENERTLSAAIRAAADAQASLSAAHATHHHLFRVNAKCCGMP